MLKKLKTLKGKIVSAVSTHLKNESSYSSESSSLTLTQQEYLQIRDIMKNPEQERTPFEQQMIEKYYERQKAKVQKQNQASGEAEVETYRK